MRVIINAIDELQASVNTGKKDIPKRKIALPDPSKMPTWLLHSLEFWGNLNYLSTKSELTLGFQIFEKSVKLKNQIGA